MSKYNILETSLDDYLIHHWERTKSAAQFLMMTGAEWEMIWTKNYWKEKFEALEKKINEI